MRFGRVGRRAALLYTGRMSHCRRPLCLLIGLAGCLLTMPGEAQAQEIRVGEPLTAALETLRAFGLDIAYSDRLVDPEFRVQADPGDGAPEQIAARILAPYGLRLEPIRPGRFAVVRADVTDLASGVETERPASAPGLDVVTVYASRYRIEAAGTGTRFDWSRADVSVLPGLDEDLLRVARYLPGTASNGLSARSNVRGGRDDEILVWFDGVPLFEPFHFKDYGAVLGVLDPAAIERLDFYSGVFPVRHGDRLSAVMDITPRSGRGGSHHELGLSLLSAHALSSGETGWRGAPLRWLAAGRSSTTQLLTRATGRDDVEPEFFDALLRVEGEIGNWTLTVGALALRDELRVRDDGSSGVDSADAEYRDAASWFRAGRELRDGRQLEATGSITSRRTGRSGSLDRPGSVSGVVDDRRRIESQHFRLEWRDPGRWVVGIEATESEATYDYSGAADFDPLLAALFARAPSFERRRVLLADGAAIAVYGSRMLELGRKWRLDSGLRGQSRRYRVDDVADPLARPRLAEYDSIDVEPRVALEYLLDDNTTLRVSAGRTTQATRPDELAVADGEVSFARRQAADQVVVGFERRLARGGTWRLEAYRKDLRNPAPRYENLLDPVTLLPELEVDRARVTPTAARLYGIEWSGRVAWSRHWSGWLSYTWSEANDRVDGRWIPRSWNQLHSLAAGSAWTPGAWELSASLLWHSGWRRSLVEPAGGTEPALVTRNGGSWDDFATLDLRATWTRPLRLGALRLWADLSNATQHRNPCCSELRVDRTGSAARIIERERDWLPRYAVVGVTWELP